MSCYWDVDVIHKLSVLNLIDAAMEVFQTSANQIRVLGTARFKLLVNKPERGAEKFGSEAFARIAAFLAAAPRVESADLHPDDAQAFADLPGIDAGEAVLFSICSRASDAVLVTGDKKALVALAASPECRPMAERLAGRVFCLEQVVLRCIERRGFDAVKNAVLDGVACDTALRAAFGSGLASTEHAVREALAAYIGELRTKVGSPLGL